MKPMDFVAKSNLARIRYLDCNHSSRRNVVIREEAFRLPRRNARGSCVAEGQRACKLSWRYRDWIGLRNSLAGSDLWQSRWEPVGLACRLLILKMFR
jgi:hypothetical protein